MSTFFGPNDLDLGYSLIDWPAELYEFEIGEGLTARELAQAMRNVFFHIAPVWNSWNPNSGQVSIESFCREIVEECMERLGMSLEDFTRLDSESKLPPSLAAAEIRVKLKSADYTCVPAER